MSPYDAILVPGGGVRPGGTLPPWVKRRFDRLLEIYQGETIIALSAGTLFKPPPLDGRGFPIFESVAGAGYLIKNGIPPAKILLETCSYDTIGNAFFARLIHVEPRQFSKLLVITSQFHMPRTETVFNWIFSLEPVFTPCTLNFLSASDEGIDETMLVERKENEKNNLLRLLETQKSIHPLPELHRWLFSQHTAYAASATPPAPKINERLLETY
jgi:uncharacterized SAM-binding protein YcdF (DUF218 family)